LLCDAHLLILRLRELSADLRYQALSSRMQPHDVVDEDQDAGSGVGSADADVVQAPGHAQRDGAGLIDAVGADAVVRVPGFALGRAW
jgi:hypothetical protein